MSEIIYADDTFIVDERGDIACFYMKCILKQREHYCLMHNSDKLAMFCIISEEKSSRISCPEYIEDLDKCIQMYKRQCHD